MIGENHTLTLSMSRAISFVPGEWYHCFHRGIDNRKTFMDRADYVRFQKLLYAANSSLPVARAGLASLAPQDAFRVFTRPRGEQLVDIGAYTLLPTRYHLLMRERQRGGLSAFMHRLNTAYTMYFNTKHRRTGTLFSGRFKAVHTDKEKYLDKVANYIHGNVSDLFTEVEAGTLQQRKIIDRIVDYEFSSLYDYEKPLRYESAILSRKLLDDSLPEPLSVNGVLKDFKTFYSKSNMRSWVRD